MCDILKCLFSSCVQFFFRPLKVCFSECFKGYSFIYFRCHWLSVRKILKGLGVELKLILLLHCLIFFLLCALWSPPFLATALDLADHPQELKDIHPPISLSALPLKPKMFLPSTMLWAAAAAGKWEGHSPEQKSVVCPSWQLSWYSYLNHKQMVNVLEFLLRSTYIALGLND